MDKRTLILAITMALLFFTHGTEANSSGAVARDNHKPVFFNCSRYQPVVKEQEPEGTRVVQVTAVDPDPGDKVTYTFVRGGPLDKVNFYIDEHTGVITTKHEFDRDEHSREKEAYITVRATDDGVPKLDDVCTFKVVIEDINDNEPMFDKVRYSESVPQDLKVNQEVMRISALDIDDGNNSIVSYELEQGSSFSDYFRIDPSSGVIFLNKPIDKPPNFRFSIQATAKDHGVPPLSRSTMLEILVVESNKKTPTIEPGQTVISIPENYSEYDTPIFTIKAHSNVEGDPKLKFEINSGVTEQSNSQNTFRLEVSDDVAFVKLAQSLNYESVTEYVLTVRVENKYSLAAQQQYTIKVTDVNDIIPAFTKFDTGYVLENEPPGTPVMQVRAIDADGTEANNQVTYELADNNEFFSIDPKTGNITTKQEFDREKQDNYIIKVYAHDNSESALLKNGQPNQGEQTYKIEIADKNDNKPYFTDRLYTASIAEDANTNSLVTEVKAVDDDTASRLTYSIVNGNKGDAFFIEPTTGKIRVNKELDYEVTTWYKLTIRVFDGIFSNETIVKIDVEDVNDNPPVFNITEDTVRIKEESIPENHCIFNILAYDPDIPDRNAPQHIVYSIIKDDQKKLLSIDANGCLSLLKPLDRDPPNGFESWQVYIVAEDQDGDPRSSQKSTTEVFIELEDINDNAPFLDMVQPIVWRENQPPGNVTVMRAKDYDSSVNGAPFLFELLPNEEIKYKFYNEGPVLFSNVTFDREEKKSYLIPVAISDSGSPSMTGTSTLTLVIGDENDNEMKSGASSIFVYNYKGEAPDTEIGRVYVDDPDDWDLPDKHFQWKDEDHPSFFNLDSNTGMITMVSGAGNGSYLLEFTVTEESLRFPTHSVTATVNVTVKVIPEEAVDKSGSLRFANMTAEEFITPVAPGVPSRKEVLQSTLATLLNVSVNNVDVFTVLRPPSHQEDYLDVRFSAHGSPYYQAERLNALVALHQEEIEQRLGAKMAMIGVDECLLEKVSCESSCSNILSKSDVPYSVFTNTTSFVGVRAVVEPQCVCRAPDVVCLNGGTQLSDRCECPPGFEGPLCEVIAVGFNGDGYALYPPFDACEAANLSLEIVSHKENGLVFYIGPVTASSAANVKDFMALFIVDGVLRLLVDYGSGTVSLNHSHTTIEPGKRYYVEILWTRTGIELKVDRCTLSACYAVTPPQGPNEFLNVNGPLQLGGAFVDLRKLGQALGWKEIPREEGFAGCIRNVTINRKTYNLGMPGDSKNVDPGCVRAVVSAVSFGINTNFLVAILICIAIFLILVLAVVVQRRKSDDMYKDHDDIRENIINYEDEGGGEGDMTGYDLNVLRCMYEGVEPDSKSPLKENLLKKGPDDVPDICGFLDGKKKVCDNDPETNPFDDVRHYAYEGDGNSTGSLSSLASGTDEGDLNFDYLSNFGPRFRKLADMYGEDPSDEDDENFHTPASESWC